MLLLKTCIFFFECILLKKERYRTYKITQSNAVSARLCAYLPGCLHVSSSLKTLKAEAYLALRFDFYCIYFFFFLFLVLILISYIWFLEEIEKKIFFPFWDIYYICVRIWECPLINNNNNNKRIRKYYGLVSMTTLCTAMICILILFRFNLLLFFF